MGASGRVRGVDRPDKNAFLVGERCLFPPCKTHAVRIGGFYREGVRIYIGTPCETDTPCACNCNCGVSHRETLVSRGLPVYDTGSGVSLRYRQ